MIAAILAKEPTHGSVYWPRDPFETKIAHLAAISRSRLLKHAWWIKLRQIATDAKTLNQEYNNATMGTIYSRGGGFLEEIMRPLAEKLNVAPPPPCMTPARIDGLAERFRDLARDTCELGGTLLKAAERLRIGRDEG